MWDHSRVSTTGSCMDLDWKVVISTLVGGVISFAATSGQEMLKNRRISRAATLSVCAEIAAVLDIARARGWAEDLQSCIDDAVEGRVTRLAILLPKDTIPCCRSALSQGTLGGGELTALVASLVIAADGLKADLDRLFEYDFDNPRSMLSDDDPRHAVKLYSEMLGLLQAIESFGAEAINLASRKLGKDGRRLRQKLHPLTKP